MTDYAGQTESRLARRKRMVAEMSNLRTLKWVGVAFVIHAIVLVATSMGTIAGFMREKHLFGLSPLAVTPPSDTAKPPEAATQPTTAPAKPAAAAVDAGSEAHPPAMSDDEKRVADLAKNGNPEAKKLTDIAKPGERPKEPSHGFKISEDP